MLLRLFGHFATGQERCQYRHAARDIPALRDKHIFLARRFSRNTRLRDDSRISLAFRLMPRRPRLRLFRRHYYFDTGTSRGRHRYQHGISRNIGHAGFSCRLLGRQSLSAGLRRHDDTRCTMRAEVRPRRQ